MPNGNVGRFLFGLSPDVPTFNVRVFLQLTTNFELQ